MMTQRGDKYKNMVQASEVEKGFRNCSLVDYLADLDSMLLMLLLCWHVMDLLGKWYKKHIPFRRLDVFINIITVI